MLPDIGPVRVGGVSVLEQDCTHITSGLGWPAFDDCFGQGVRVIAPEPLTVIPNPATGALWTSSNPGDAFYARGDSGLIYWYGHLDRLHAVGTRFKKSALVGLTCENHIGGGPHCHVAIDARPVLGHHLVSHSNYTHGAPKIGVQLAPAFKPAKPAGTWFQWAAWYLGEGVFKGHKRDPRLRPNVPARIPLRWWARLAAFLARR